jgi:hypothetical protein
MEPIDICYTPLDIPKRPDVDINKFLSWAQSAYPQSCKSKSDNAEDTIGRDYPWDLVWGAWNGVWQNNFDKEFPELAKYCYEAFSIQPHELSGAIFLPVRKSVRGVSFWHNDVDPTGFRFYLECEHYNDNPLLLRKTKLPYNNQGGIVVSLGGDDDRLQKEIYNCKMTDPHMAYYLNNFRAVHAPTVNVPGIRIAAFITIKKVFQDIVQKRTRDMIVTSAEKFKDYAVVW